MKRDPPIVIDMKHAKLECVEHETDVVEFYKKTSEIGIHLNKKSNLVVKCGNCFKLILRLQRSNFPQIALLLSPSTLEAQSSINRLQPKILL